MTGQARLDGDEVGGSRQGRADRQGDLGREPSLVQLRDERLSQVLPDRERDDDRGHSGTQHRELASLTTPPIHRLKRPARAW